MKHLVWSNMLLIWVILFASLLVPQANSQPNQNDLALHGKKVLWVDSYHQGYPWSDGVELGIRKVLKNSGVDLHVHRMDTKKNNSVEFCNKAGILAKQKVESLQPDLVIATDDNAQKFLIVPYLKGTDLPVVFSGVNWDADDYGYPAKNITGMVEIDLVEELLSLMQQDTMGSRVGFLSTDVITARKSAEEINDRFLDNKMRVYMVKTFSEFKQQFLKAQEEVDMLILYNYIGIQDWDSIGAESFLARNTRIPTGTMVDFLKQFVIYTNSKSPEEQGEYAAQTALRVLAGADPAKIPITTNKRSKLTVNLKMAKAANIIIPLPILKTAEIIGRDAYEEKGFQYKYDTDSYHGKKVVWVDSYHEGYEWSDGIGKGIKEIFIDKGIVVKKIHMDTKRNKSIEFCRQAALDSLKEIDDFKPDLIIASDDNAQKYLVVPYLLQKKIPIIFCGVNKDATMYGYPKSNVTGMLEIEPIDALLELLGQYAKGKKVGYLYGDTETEQKMVASYQQNVFAGKLKTYKAETFADFMRLFLTAQQEVDMMIIPNHAGIIGWQSDVAEKFIREHVRIPTGSFIGFMDRYVLFTMANSPVEQGSYAATTALRIFNGEKISGIPIAKNKTGDTTINVKIADGANIVLPISVLKNAKTVIGQETFWQQ